jgi:hypothetical protein
LGSVPIGRSAQPNGSLDSPNCSLDSPNCSPESPNPSVDIANSLVAIANSSLDCPEPPNVMSSDAVPSKVGAGDASDEAAALSPACPAVGEFLAERAGTNGISGGAFELVTARP